MPYLYLACAMICSAALNLLGTRFNRKNAARQNATGIYNILVACSAALPWAVITLTNPSFDPAALLYSIGYGVCFTMAICGLIGALKHGPVPLTAFAKQLSLICVSLWGFVFWRVRVTACTVIGLLLLAVSLYLCFLAKEKHVQNPPRRVTGRWVLYVLVLIVGNAGCSIIQKYQQMVFDGRHGGIMMLCASALSVGLCALLSRRNPTPRWREIVRDSWYYPAAAGLSSALMNWFVILLASTTLSPSVIYPGQATGGFILTTLISVIFMGEKIRFREGIGLSIGAAALVFLSL